MKILKLAMAVAISAALCGCSSGSMGGQNDTNDTQSRDTAENNEVYTESEDDTADFAEELMAEMSIEEKVGQLLLARYPDSPLEAAVKYHVGGFTLYAKDFENTDPDTLATQLAVISDNCDIFPFFAADEEGGEVVRMSKYPAFRAEPFPSQLELAKGGVQAVRDDAQEKADLFLDIGLNLNLAPVADIAESEDDYIYGRTFGADAETTGDYCAEIISVMNENGVGSCMKHFPGYGPNVDTHTGIAVDERSAESFENNDLIPFKKGIAADVPMIMVNHNIISAYDSELPASLSPAVHSLLRDTMGFEGIIITDDLGMDAIKLYSGETDPNVLAVLAGNDMICTSDIEGTYNAIYTAVVKEEISVERLDESVLRILKAKIKLGII